MATNRMTVIGDCEADCGKTQVEVWNTRGNILMCAECKAADEAILEQSIAGNKIIQQTKAVDTSIETKADLFNATTVSIIQIKGSIWADENIPAGKKQYAYTQVCAEHFESLQKAIFEERQALLAKENAMRAWQIAAQTAAGELTATEREHFKKLNVSYQPTAVKSIKPAKSHAPRAYKGNELRDAAAKYNVPAQMIQLIVIQRKLSADDAGKVAAEQIAKVKSAN